VQPGDDFFDIEWFGDVVIAAGAEAAQPVGQRVAGGQEQHGRVHPPCAQRLAEVPPVGVGQADVDHQRIRRLI
jgi:hypothetical protein